MASAADLVCVGHIVQEMIHFPDRVEGPFLGSPPAYCSVAAARQDTPTGLVSRIGPEMPEWLLLPLREAGVDTAGLRREGDTTLSELRYDAQGHKEIRYPVKADPIKAADIPKAYRNCALIYVCPMDNDVLPEDLDGVVACGRLSAVDLGGYGGVHVSPEHRQAMDSSAELACRVAEHFNIVKASDEDARAIFGFDDLEESAGRLLARGPEVVLITAGARGAFVYTAEGGQHVPALPGSVVDATGGGDVFMAGYLCEYLRSRDPIGSARWGAATALCVIEQSGGVRLERMPTRQAVRDRIIQAGQRAHS